MSASKFLDTGVRWFAGSRCPSCSKPPGEHDVSEIREYPTEMLNACTDPNIEVIARGHPTSRIRMYRCKKRKKRAR